MNQIHHKSLPNHLKYNPLYNVIIAPYTFYRYETSYTTYCKWHWHHIFENTTEIIVFGAIKAENKQLSQVNIIENIYFQFTFK